MNARRTTAWPLTGFLVLTLAAAVAIAQQDEGPILRPKPKPKPAAPTFLVTCDLSCNWKLDGKAQGHIDAGGSATVTVSLGLHEVVAVTDDGLDQVAGSWNAKSPGQTDVRISLQSTRDLRLKVEQDARDKAAQEAKEKADQEARDQAARDQTTRDEEARLTWPDPATGLIWAREDSGKHLTWQQAIDYCRNLQFAGHADWRLPAIDELEGIAEKRADCDRCYWKGNLQPSSSWDWSSTQNPSPGEAWFFDFMVGSRRVEFESSDITISAFCVRHPGESRDQQEKEQQERNLIAREQIAGRATDPATGLMWTVKESDKEMSLDQAAKYCRNLRLGGYSDWRLPTVDDFNGCKIRDHLGGFGDWIWVADDDSMWNKAYRGNGTVLNTAKRIRSSYPAMCVRDSAK